MTEPTCEEQQLSATSTCVAAAKSVPVHRPLDDTTAQSMMSSSSADLSSMNDLGVSRYLSGDQKAAMVCFERALRIRIDSSSAASSSSEEQQARRGGGSHCDARRDVEAAAAPSSTRHHLNEYDVPEPRPEADADGDTNLIGMGRFVSPLSVDACRADDDEDETKNDVATAVLLYNISLVKMSQRHYSVVVELLELALKELDASSSNGNDDNAPSEEEEGSNSMPKMSSPRLRMMIQTNLGMSLYRLGQFDDAADCFDDAAAVPGHLLQEVQRTYREDPLGDGALLNGGSGCGGGRASSSSSASQKSVKAILGCLAYSLVNGARAREASNDWRSSEALAMVREAAGLPETVQSCFGGDRDEDEDEQCECDRAALEADLSSGMAYVEASVRHRRGELKAAEEHYRLCIERAAATTAASSSSSSGKLLPLRAAAALNGLGRVLFERRRLSESILPLRSAWSIRQSHLGEDHPESIDALYVLGRALHDAEEMADALSVYERTYSLQKRVFGPDNVDSLRTLCNVARIRRICGMGEGALEACREALEAGRKSLGEDHPFVSDMNAMQGVILYEMGRVEEAAQFVDLAKMLNDRGEGKSKDTTLADGPCFRGRSHGAAAA